MPTAEIHDAEGNYAGYARFDANGAFQGTAGARGKNGASRVQNAERTVAMRAARRERAGGRRVVTNRRARRNA